MVRILKRCSWSHSGTPADQSCGVEEAVHTKTLFCENGSQGGRIGKRSPPILVWICTLSKTMTPSLTVHTNSAGFFVLAIVVFFLLCLVSPSTVCLFTACKLHAHALSLLLCLWWMSSATYRPGRWTTAFWIVFSGSVWTQIFLKRSSRKTEEKDCFGTCGCAAASQTCRLWWKHVIISASSEICRKQSLRVKLQQRLKENQLKVKAEQQTG